MFYLAHISDIHLAPLPVPTLGQLFGKRITGYINWKKHRGLNLESHTLNRLMQELHMRGPDHLAITGDLVNLALDQEFAQARKWLYEQGDPKDISLVFGNHDAYVIGAFKRACQYFKPWISSDIETSKQALFPYLRIRDRVAIIGVSSAVATSPFCAVGHFSRKQARALRTLCDLCREQHLFTVVLIHHPPLTHAATFYKKLWGIKRLQKVVAECGANLILHGHTHLPTLSYINGTNGDFVPVVGISSASQSFNGKKPAAAFNWFAIEQRDNQWSCMLSRYSVINDQDVVRCTQTQKLCL